VWISSPSSCAASSNLAPEQNKQIDDFQKEVDAKLDKDAQRGPEEADPRGQPVRTGWLRGFPPFPARSFLEVDPWPALKPTAEQQRQLDDLQKGG